MDLCVFGYFTQLKVFQFTYHTHTHTLVACEYIFSIMFAVSLFFMQLIYNIGALFIVWMASKYRFSFLYSLSIFLALSLSLTMDRFSFPPSFCLFVCLLKASFIFLFKILWFFFSNFCFYPSIHIRSKCCCCCCCSVYIFHLI